MKFITVTLNPAIDKLYSLDKPFRVGALNRTPFINEPVYSGKGINVSRELKNLGIPSSAVCILKGEEGKAFYSSLCEEEITPLAVFDTGKIRQNIAIIDVNGLSTEINEPGDTVTKDGFINFLKLYDRVISEPEEKIIFLSGSIPGGFRADIYEMLIKNAKKNRAYVILDADGKALKQGINGKPDLIKPNEAELTELTGIKIEGPERQKRISALTACNLVFDSFGVEVLCTLAENGSIFVGREGQFVCPAKPVNAKKFKGAGDVFLTNFIFERKINGREIFESMKKASERCSEYLEQL